MQIQYCDTCNVRIDESDVVAVGDQVFCPQCAAKVPNRRASSTNLGARPRTPAAGGARLTPSARRTPASGNVVMPARPPSKPAGATGTRNRAVPEAAAQTPAAKGGKVLPIIIVGVVVVIAAAAVFMTLSATQNPPTDKPPAATGKKPDDTPGATTAAPVTTAQNAQPAGAATTSPTGAATTTASTNADPEAARPGGGLLSSGKLNDDGGMGEIRENAAKRELEKLIGMEKGGANNAILRKRYEKFVASYGSTPAGKQAAERLKNMPADAKRPPDAASGKPGLLAKIYEKDHGDIWLQKTDLSKLRLRNRMTVEWVDFPNKEKLKDKFGSNEQVVVELIGYIDIPKDGDWKLELESDDGSLLYIGDILMIDNDFHHGSTAMNCELSLKAGLHEIIIQYYQGTGDASLVFRWEGPGQPKAAVPETRLYH